MQSATRKEGGIVTGLMKNAANPFREAFNKNSFLATALTPKAE